MNIVWGLPGLRKASYGDEASVCLNEHCCTFVLTSLFL